MAGGTGTRPIVLLLARGPVSGQGTPLSGAVILQYLLW